MDQFYQPTQIDNVGGIFLSQKERVRHAKLVHYVVGDLLMRPDLEVEILDGRIEGSTKMRKRMVTEFAVAGLQTSVPYWQIEANRFLNAKSYYLYLPDEAFVDYEGREEYKQYWFEALRARLGTNGAAGIVGICASDYRSWKVEVSGNLGYHIPQNERLYDPFQGIREKLDDFSLAISKKDFYLEISVKRLLEELRVSKSVLNDMVRVRKATLDRAEFRVVREMNGQLVTVYPLLLRYSDDS